MKTKILIVAALVCSMAANVVTIIQNKNLKKEIAQNVEETPVSEPVDNTLSDWNTLQRPSCCVRARATKSSSPSNAVWAMKPPSTSTTKHPGTRRKC